MKTRPLTALEYTRALERAAKADTLWPALKQTEWLTEHTEVTEDGAIINIED